MKVLVIEDEPGLAGVLERGLGDEGHAVVVARNAAQGAPLAQSGTFDFILLDLGLPDGDGLSIARGLRAQGQRTPVMIITARDAVEDRIAGLRQGADDYLVKPFAFGELLARMDAIVRRGAPAPASTVPIADPLQVGPLSLDYARKTVAIAGQPVPLTVKELDVLRLLASEPSRIFSRHEILRLVWQLDEDPLTNIVEVYISRLRRKLRGSGLDAIDNVRGFGYRYVIGE